MANTFFTAGEIIEGESQGAPYKFQAIKEGVQGAGAIYGPGMDLLENKKVFLKKYFDPAPRSKWFDAFVQYQLRVKEKIEASSNASQLVAGIHRSFQDARRRFWQTIEFVEDSRDLKSYLESSDTTWEQRMMFAKVFMYAMRTLHDEVKLVHGDLKPANLLLIPRQGSDGYNIKLIDFDRPIFTDVSEIPWEATEGHLGSPGYYSPEHKKGKRPTEKSDVFTCGIILYELLTKEGHPFNCGDVSSDYTVNETARPQLLGSFGNEETDNQVADILHRTLNPNPDDRPTAAEVHEVLLRGRQSRAPRRSPETARPFVVQPVRPPTEPKKGAADIVFLIDATSSMSPCITALKQHVHSFIHSLVSGDEASGIVSVDDWRARVVGYRDFNDCNQNARVARMYSKFGGGGWLLSNPFTNNEQELHDQLDTLKPFGGGPEPEESLLDALMLVMKSGFLPPGEDDDSGDKTKMRWRTGGVGKVVVIFTDAGYHPNMSYTYERTQFGEGETHPLNLVGAGLDELGHVIEAGSFKIYVFAPRLPDYDELSDLSNVMILQSDEEGGGLEKTVADRSKFEKLITDIVKGVSRSASEFREISMDSF